MFNPEITTKGRGKRRQKHACLGPGCHFLREGAGTEKLKPLSPSPHHAGKPPQQSWLLMSQCKSRTRRVYPSLCLHDSHFSFFLCQAHHEWERGETGELFASPPPSGSGRRQPLSLVTEGKERDGEIKCETKGGGVRCLLMYGGVWCQVDISTTELAVCSPPCSPNPPISPRCTTPTDSKIASPKVCQGLPLSNPVTNELGWASEPSRCRTLMSCEAHPLPGWFEDQCLLNSRGVQHLQTEGEPW